MVINFSNSITKEYPSKHTHLLAGQSRGGHMIGTVSWAVIRFAAALFFTPAQKKEQKQKQKQKKKKSSCGTKLIKSIKYIK